jgi:hypothetical protein
VGNAGPAPRSWHFVTYDMNRQRTVLFGGVGSTETLSDTWEWDGQSWIQVADTGPSPRAFGAITYDSVNKRVILFGGQQGQPIGDLGDTWSWDGTDWTQLEEKGPSP